MNHHVKREALEAARSIPFLLLVWAIVQLIGAWWSILVAVVAGVAFAYVEALIGVACKDSQGRSRESDRNAQLSDDNDDLRFQIITLREQLEAARNEADGLKAKMRYLWP